MNPKLLFPHFNHLILVFVLAIAGVFPSAETRAQFENTAFENGWKESPWLGFFFDTFDPWLFHNEHGWVFSQATNNDSSANLFDRTLGWYWTNGDTYPTIYSFDRSTWMFYALGTTEPRKFFDYAIGEWISLEFEQSQFSYDVFNLTNSLLPREEILDGGPGKDGIPAIDQPEFVSIAEAVFMEEGDILLSVTSGGETRAYPFRILNWHEVVNDQVGEDYFSVTYCPLCGTGIVFDRMVNGELLDFGVSGLLWTNNLLMYDRKTNSLWSQFSLQAVTGSQIGTRLTWRLSEQLTWETWRQKFPDGKVLSTATGFLRDYSRNPYNEHDSSPFPFFRVDEIRPDLPAKAWVWGIDVDGVGKAYPLERLIDGEPVLDTFNGVNLQLTLDEAAKSVAVINLDTGEEIVGVGAFWFSWQAFYEDTEVFTGL